MVEKTQRVGDGREARHIVRRKYAAFDGVDDPGKRR